VSLKRPKRKRTSFGAGFWLGNLADLEHVWSG
jgi:hypothetical protein